jgi:type VI secretion system secreted protein VgrG
MPQTKANESRFAFSPSTLGDDVFQVVRFSGEEEISGTYSFSLLLVSEEPDVDFSQLINQPATLTVDRDGAPVPICGIVTEVSQTGQAGDYYSYEAELKPRLWRLSLTKHSRIFQEMSVEEIITEVLKENGLSTSDFKFELSGSYAPRTYCVQYEESDLAFIQRLMAFEGISYHFDHTSGNDVVVMVDDRSARSMIGGETTLRFAGGAGLVRDQSEHIESFVYKQEITTGKVTLKDYNYETPDTDLQVEEEIASDMPGEIYSYGAKYSEAGQGKRIATVRAEEASCRQKTFTGMSDCAGLITGFTFTLEGHYRGDLNEDYLITSVEHEGSQQQALGLAGLNLPGVSPYGDASGDGAAPESVYRNEFTAVPASVSFRPAYEEKHRPDVPSIMTAKIESAGGDYAYIDDDGRYRAKMHFDRSGATDGTATKPIRMATPNSGPDYGMHFPNHAGAEMVVGFVNGDIDRPLALGTVPNPTQKSPAISENRMQNLLRTFGGNELLMDDTTEEAQVRLRSAEQHELLMDDKEDRVQVLTTGEHTILLDDKNKRIEIQSTKGRKILLDDENEVMSIVSEKGHFAHLSDKDDNVTIADADGNHELTLDFKNEKLSLITKGDIGLEAEGSVEIKGESILLESKKDTTVDAGGNLAQSAGNNATVEAGSNASVDAGQNVDVVAGANLACEGGQKADLTGTNVTVEASMNLTTSAGMQTELSGNTVKVQGASMADIKAAMVKIN